MPLAKFATFALAALFAFGACASDLPHVVMSLDYTKFLAKGNK